MIQVISTSRYLVLWYWLVVVVLNYYVLYYCTWYRTVRFFIMYDISVLYSTVDYSNSSSIYFASMIIRAMKRNSETFIQLLVN